MGEKRRFISIGLAFLLLGVSSITAVVSCSQRHPAGGLADSQTSESNDGWRDSTLPPQDLKTSSREVEIVWGKVGVLLTTSVYEWKHLSLVEQIIVLCGSISCTAGLICLIVAGRRIDA